MSISAYQKAASKQPLSSADVEAQAFEQINRRLAGSVVGDDCNMRIESLVDNARFWTLLVEDLAVPENALPQQLKGNLISLGLWSIKYSQRAMMENISLDPLLKVNANIAAGLREQNAHLRAPPPPYDGMSKAETA